MGQPGDRRTFEVTSSSLPSSPPILWKLYYKPNVQLQLPTQHLAFQVSDHTGQVKHTQCSSYTFSSALVCLEKGLGIDEGNIANMAKLLYTRALLNTRYERLKSAVSDCTSALEYQTSHYKGLAKRGSLHLEMEKYAEVFSAR